MKTIFTLFFSFVFISCFAQEYLPISTGEIVKHDFYTLSYNEKHEQAEWVYYVLTPSMISDNQERTEDFRPDPFVKTGSATLADYKGSGYDRGHLAPAGDMEATAICNSQSFYMSNMSPQVPAFNRGGWKELESIVRNWAFDFKEIYVVTGPVFRGNLGTIGTNEVTVPGYYYKVIYVPSKQIMIGFELPNEKITQPLTSYARSVDVIESLTGIDFFQQLTDSLENTLESSFALDYWSFSNTTVQTAKQNKEKIVQCKGINTDNTRCAYMTPYESGYCALHQSQGKENQSKAKENQTTTEQCKGIAKSTGVRCKNTTKNANGYCDIHKDQAPDYVKPKSAGYTGQCCATTKKGTRCSRNAANGTRYCWQHQ